MQLAHNNLKSLQTMATCLASGSSQESSQQLTPLCHRCRVQVSQNTVQAYNLWKRNAIQLILTVKCLNSILFGRTKKGDFIINPQLMTV